MNDKTNNNLAGNYLEPKSLKWLYIDINSYFATIEQQLEPAYRGKPIAVVPVLADSTCAIAASYEAKAKGIKTGTRIYEAKKLCPELICIVANHQLYVQYHHKIFAEVDKHLHVDHIFSIDEAACRLTGEYVSEAKAVMVAKQIKLAIKQNVGEYISCSIGIAPNRYLAKIATDMQKPDGLVVIRPEDIPHKLYSLKLKDIPGVGKRVYTRLSNYGIDSVEKLYQQEAKRLRQYWGSIWGEKVCYLLRGADLPIERAKSQTIGHSQVLAPKFKHIDNARIIAISLILKAAVRLRAKKLYARNVALSIGLPNSNTLKQNINIEPASDSNVLTKALLSIWDGLIITHKLSEIKKISISLHGLQGESSQLSLLDWEGKKDNTSTQRLSEAIDKLNAKFGKNTVTLGQLPQKQDRKDASAFGYIAKDEQ